MSNFEFVFSLFALLLGFSLVEVLGGLGRTVKLGARIRLRGAREGEQVRIGWLTPLLGLIVMLDLTSFWVLAWHARDHVPPTYEALMAGLLITGIYYLAAMLVFPERPEEWPDLDDFYMTHRRPVVAGVAACNILAHSAGLAIGSETVPDAPAALAVVAVFYALLAGAFVAKRPRVQLAILATLAAFYVFGGLAVRALG
ncbi:MAG TPA: hypothetical protein VEW26_05085 [Allosphingosinicella sp.]|nr:hypothetical protein [Allosphingosinicella sp.]